MQNDQLKNVVKYVVEYAYHQFKREFGDDDDSKELMRRYKVPVFFILAIWCSDVMLLRLPYCHRQKS